MTTTQAIALPSGIDADPVVALRRVMTGETWALDAAAGAIMIGSASACDVRVGDMACRPEEPVDVSARHGERLRLRIAPGEAPPVHLDYEPDSDHARAHVHAVVYVPPSPTTR